jgi:hypothetical protein
MTKTSADYKTWTEVRSVFGGTGCAQAATARKAARSTSAIGARHFGRVAPARNSIIRLIHVRRQIVIFGRNVQHE